MTAKNVLLRPKARAPTWSPLLRHWTQPKRDLEWKRSNCVWSRL